MGSLLDKDQEEWHSTMRQYLSALQEGLDELIKQEVVRKEKNKEQPDNTTTDDEQVAAAAAAAAEEDEEDEDVDEYLLAVFGDREAHVACDYLRPSATKPPYVPRSFRR